MVVPSIGALRSNVVTPAAKTGTLATVSVFTGDPATGVVGVTINLFPLVNSPVASPTIETVTPPAATVNESM